MFFADFQIFFQPGNLGSYLAMSTGDRFLLQGSAIYTLVGAAEMRVQHLPVLLGIVLNYTLFIIVLDSCCFSVGDLTRGCLVFLKDRQVSKLGCFVFEFWVLRFRVLGASFSSLGYFIFEIWVFRASVFFF